MRIPDSISREIVARALTGEDYRPVIVQIIDAEFLNYVVDFFKELEKSLDAVFATSEAHSGQVREAPVSDSSQNELLLDFE